MCFLRIECCGIFSHRIYAVRVEMHRIVIIPRLLSWRVIEYDMKTLSANDNAVYDRNPECIQKWM